MHCVLHQGIVGVRHAKHYGRLLVFVDYNSVNDATNAMIKHQDFRFPGRLGAFCMDLSLPVSDFFFCAGCNITDWHHTSSSHNEPYLNKGRGENEGLMLDFDKDPTSRRNAAYELELKRAKRQVLAEPNHLRPCEICGDTIHKTVDCPTEKQCERCGGTGHITAACCAMQEKVTALHAERQKSQKVVPDEIKVALKEKLDRSAWGHGRHPKADTGNSRPAKKQRFRVVSRAGDGNTNNASSSAYMTGADPNWEATARPNILKALDNATGRFQEAALRQTDADSKDNVCKGEVGKTSNPCSNMTSDDDMSNTGLVAYGNSDSDSPG